MPACRVNLSIQVDRFQNGDPANDGTNIPDVQQQYQNSTKHGLPDYRHGGDIQGIIDRLETALNITPNSRFAGFGLMHDGVPTAIEGVGNFFPAQFF